MTHSQLFQEAIRALNLIPRTNLPDNDDHPFRDTYALVAAMEKAAREKHSVTVVLGEQACRALDNPDVTRADIEEQGGLFTATYDTVEELDAYCTGIEDAEGYLDAALVSADEYPQLFLEDVT